ncbi:hypothetical protein [Helicobacter cinaedi]|uniref:hypothetical protein n=1 Tax=Helicobacter cinaedi TaxID=213 RepID=UPI0015F0D793|nr:hypothetical protein [Helicobacter cinaedi]
MKNALSLRCFLGSLRFVLWHYRLGSFSHGNAAQPQKSLANSAALHTHSCEALVQTCKS